MGARHAVELLIDEAWALHAEGRYADMLRVAARAVEAAQRLDEGLGLEVRAREVEASALRQTGDQAAALVHYTWMLALPEDPSTRARVAAAGVERQIAEAYMNWVACALFLPEMPVARLFGVLDAGEAWLRSVGRAGWRAGLVSQRAAVLKALGRPAEAVGYAEEAVALKERHPDAPGYTLSAYRWDLGDLMRETGRPADALPHYERVLDDPSAGPYDRGVALGGLARATLDLGRVPEATAHARAAVAALEPMGAIAVAPAYEVLIAALLAGGEHAEARRASERYLRLTRSLGPYHAWFAHRDALEVAVATADVSWAQTLLSALAPLSAALDRQHGDTRFSKQIAALAAKLPPEPA